MEQTPETELRPIYKPTSKYNLQDALGLKNEKQRWLAYLEIMRECLYEKNVDFTTDYRSQKHTITAQIVRSFKKKAPVFPITAADWAVKEMLVSTIQNKRYYLKKKKNELENNLRVPPQNSPALQDRPPPSPQAQQDPPSPVEPSDEQVQIRPPVGLLMNKFRSGLQNHVLMNKFRSGLQNHVLMKKFKVILQKGSGNNV
ncbi:uncharacterized protein OCT59_030050 [Rhizophagus irregularis]|uniref:uncharacterized protein n=1 Tax=Rhizophagus irregularis TaxID=588596 RepID=UPI00331E3F07|nr:hypothetical protein OCT59_030050 [Rhizophagus irregularis]